MNKIYKNIEENGGPNQIQIIENGGRALAKMCIKMLRGKKFPRIVLLIGTACNSSIGNFFLAGKISRFD